MQCNGNVRPYFILLRSNKYSNALQQVVLEKMKMLEHCFFKSPYDILKLSAKCLLIRRITSLSVEIRTWKVEEDVYGHGFYNNFSVLNIKTVKNMKRV